EAVTQPSTYHRHYNVPDEAVFAGVHLSWVAFPSHKVMLHDTASRHFGNFIRYYADPRVKVLALTADGAVAALATADTNRGWHPLKPAQLSWTRFRYDPTPWEGPPPSAGEEIMNAQ